MPGLGGIHLADRISSLYLGVKVLYMSGYSDFEPGYHGLGQETTKAFLATESCREASGNI